MSQLAEQIFPGLKNPVSDAQDVFRQLLNSMAQPGLISTINHTQYHPESLYPATYAVALTLFDQETLIKLSPSLQHGDIESSLKFHASIRVTQDYHLANFVLCNEQDRPDLDLLNPGSETYPDESCTLIIQSESLYKGIIYRASGPGIEKSRKIRCSAFNGSLIHQREKLAVHFPLGVDLIVTCGQEFFCIPRTTTLIAEPN